MSLFTSHPETLRDRIKAIPVDRIREHIRASAYWHWRGSESGRAIIADGCDMKQSITQYATEDEFKAAGESIGYPHGALARCLSCIRTADRSSGKQPQNPDLKYYRPEARARMKKETILKNKREKFANMMEKREAGG